MKENAIQRHLDKLKWSCVGNYSEGTEIEKPGIKHTLQAENHRTDTKENQWNGEQLRNNSNKEKADKNNEKNRFNHR